MVRSIPMAGTTVVDPLQLILKESARLPSLPEVLLNLDKELGKENVDFHKVGSLVGMDPVLSGQILRLANSSWYSPGGNPIQDLPRALIRLGVPTTKQLVHALVMPALFPKNRGEIDLDAFWKHSFAVALFAQAIGRRLKLPRVQLELLWTAGLLHDIGALVFDTTAAGTYKRLLRICAAEATDSVDPQPVDFCALEREWFGVDHATMGSTFLEKFWKLPADIVWCVRYHEDPGWSLHEARARESIIPIHIASTICEERGVSWLPPRARSRRSLDPAWEILGFPEAVVDEMAQEVDKSLQQADTMLLRS